MIRLIALFCTVFVSACGGGGSSSTANDAGNPTPTPNTTPPVVDDSNVLEIRFLMDGYGKSRLYIQEDQLWWLHINGEAPGMASTSPAPTYLDSQPWEPSWPAQGVNAFCGCESQPRTLANVVFSENIAVETLSSNEIRILQQTLDSGTMTAIIEIENLSSVPLWKTFTIKEFSEAEDGDLTDTTAVADLLIPEVDEVARLEYELNSVKRARLDAIIAENVMLEIPPESTESLPFSSVYRGEWMLYMSNELPAAACVSSQILRTCYDVSRSECEIVMENETNRCLNEYSDMIPAILRQPDDGGNWGGVIGGCAGDAYAVALAEWKDPECD